MVHDVRIGGYVGYSLRDRSQAKGKDTGYWINCVLDRVGLTGRQAVEELNGGFGASVGGSERTLERECVLDAMAYAIDKEGCGTDENVLGGLMDAIRAEYVLTDLGVISDWFWDDAEHG
ncbi:hypothetical protein F2Q70_00000647 [Brassica cretica]|uniref:Uncharacterized protein n=1 Tax=Brassica cretica TaxID=69181 RepID=A0A8S9J058_BRACR|nr:hypothetical protein F2Q70_00000647 [Brassica cretica]